MSFRPRGLRLALGFLWIGPAAQAAITNLQIIGVTATQAVVTYQAPDANACRLEVSQSNTYAPLVHDVDPALFSGSNQDSRAGSRASGPSRIVVFGKRLADTRSLDGSTYSRALQADTKHYFRITCGADQTSGFFTTANIPLGMTYNDVPQPDVDRPGQWAIPTMIQDRQQTIVDPQTGALLKRISLDAEKINPAYYSGPFLTYGGFNRVCSPTMTGPAGGPQGYLCSLMNYNGGPNLLYFIVPTTGEVRYLGSLPYGAQVNGADLSFYTTGGDGNLYKVPYTGNFVATAGGAPTGAWVLYNSVSTNQMMKNFDPSFDTTLFGCGKAIAGPGDYALIQCNRSIQDSYGWLGVLYGGDGRPITTANCAPSDTGCPRIVAAMNVVAAPETRWCSLHNVQLVPDNPLISINFQELKDFSGGLGTAPMATSLASGIDAGQTSITVAGEPVSLATGGDPFRQNAAVGDIFRLGTGPQETVQITGITALANGQRTWQVSRTNGQAFPAGTVVWAACKAGFHIAYWKFENDVHGTDATNTDVVVDQYWDGGGHWDSGPLGRISESGSGWAAVFGKVIDNLNKPLSLQIDDSPPFAGAKGLDYGSTTSKHPSYHQVAAQTSLPEQQWFLDMMPFDGGNLFSDNPGAVLVSGQLYKYAPVGALARKNLPTLASSGGKALVDKSGPNSVISDQASDAYTYCIANAPGECRPGSSAGAVYMNVPNVQYLFCTGGDGPNSANRDLCLGNAGAYVQSMAQIYLGRDSGDSAAHSRTLTHGLAGIKEMFYYSTAKSLPDASWALFNNGDLITGNTVNVWMAKIPPLTAQDSLDRSTFLPLTLNLSAPAGASAASITNAVVQFGYEEQGSSDQYFCTSRREVCEAGSTTINPANPFYFRSETHGGVSCPGGNCTISVPVLPMHTAYFQVLFRDSNNVTLAYSQGISAELSAKTLGGGVVPQTLITGLSVEVGSSSANVHWSTNNPTDGQVQYGVSASYGQSIPLDPQVATSHSAILPNLAANATYYFRVQSADSLSNTVTRDGQFFTQSQTLPTPTLSLPAFLPVNATVTASVPPESAVDHFVWTFTPLAVSGTSSFALGAASSGAPTITFPTRGASASLAQAALGPGKVLISVQSADFSGNTSKAASVTITLVPANLTSAKIYPNPWRRDKHAGHPVVTFAGLTVGTTIKIFTVSGIRVKELHTDGSSVPWDLTNDAGDKVASGVYLYLIVDAQGDKARGKLAIVK